MLLDISINSSKFAVVNVTHGGTLFNCTIKYLTYVFCVKPLYNFEKL